MAQACIYGVDLNPLAVELAKLSLWLATVSKDKPLSFLDHHLRCGNSLIGARVADLPLGLAPAEQVAKERKAAYKAQEAARKKEEAARAAGQITMLDDSAFAGAMHTASGMMRLIEDLGSETLADVHRAEEVYRDSVRAVTERARLLGDVWTARHFGLALDETMWGGLSRYLLHGGFEMPAYRPVIDQARAIADERRFFHWELEFPEVFFDEHGRLVEGGGFDVVMGNPPYGDILERDSKTYLAAVTLISTAGRSDVYADFIVRCAGLLAEERLLGFIIPNTLIDGGSFAELRRTLTQMATPIRIRDFKTRHVFDAAEVLTMVICLSKSVATKRSLIVYEHWDDASADFKVDDIGILPGAIDPWHITSLVMDRIESIGLCLPLEPGIGTCHDAGVDYKWKDVGWQHRGEQPRFAKLLFYSGDRQHPSDYALVKGEGVNRYWLDAGASWWLIHDYQKYRTPQTTVLVYLNLALVGRKILTRQTSDRIQAATDSTGLVTAKSIHTTIVRAEGYSEEFLLAVLNSRLLTYIYQLRTGEVGRTFAQVKLYDLRQLPIRRIAFTAPVETRAALAAEAQRLAAVAVTTGDFTTVLAFVAEQLTAQLERSDVIHDLLAGLAEQMIAMNKQKGDEMRGFLAWLERETGARIEDLTGKSLLRDYLGDYQKGAPPLPFADVLAVLRKNPRKLTVDPGGRRFQEALKKEYEASLAVLLPLKARLTATDRLIDQVVYRLYGLTQEEIAVVEGRGD